MKAPTWNPRKSHVVLGRILLFFGSRYSIVIMRRYIKVAPIAIIPISFGTDSPVDCNRDSCHTYTDVTYPRHYFPYLNLAIRPGAHSSYAHETDKDDLGLGWADAEIKSSLSVQKYLS
jgi:hypothetical protein